MTSFVHIDQPAEHLGVTRASAAIERIRASNDNVGTAGLTVRIVIAAGAVLLAIANQLTTREVDGGWMVAWIAVCAILFGALALSAHKLTPFLARLSERRAVARADAQFYEYAKYDPRILQELQAAVTRQQTDGISTPVATAKVEALTLMKQRSEQVRMPTLYEAMTRLNNSRYY
ncbi:hypothetical protein [Variovorax sp. PAMC 28711]|uniref:hypothetical protein n=1 Tax=Variovorax sp. PAMC 28711 TaxID=1795631 RepID=UPI00078B57F5|nr:hypothetical protein [Variovorax sp. PAMC 28711]AMM24642.1 hypothetical protein AX767_09995 [Variovorax sp. PAMC 28711]